MSEIWKDIECYEGCYQISNLGNVRSLDRLIVKSDGRTARYRGQNIAQTINGNILNQNDTVIEGEIPFIVAERFPLNVENVSSD